MQLFNEDDLLTYVEHWGRRLKQFGQANSQTWAKPGSGSILLLALSRVYASTAFME